MKFRRLFLIILFIFSMADLSWAGLEELARSGRWELALKVASRRAGQLPLNAGESMIVASAARTLGDLDAERRFLSEAVTGGQGDLLRLAEVQLAERMWADEPDYAVGLILPSLSQAPSLQVRVAAVDVAGKALKVGVQTRERQALEKVTPKLPRSLRRRLEFALALGDTERGRQRLGRLLQGSTGDSVALSTAEKLLEYQPLAAIEEWRVAKTYYQHALYQKAAPLLEKLDMVSHASIPKEEVAYLRGRCSFRRGEWTEAGDWYQKAISKARQASRRAELEVHLSRTFELHGLMDEAVAAAQRAVRLKTTDERRLFLARLRLRRGERELATQGISRIRGRTARAQAGYMLGLDDLRRDEFESARRHLQAVQRRPWSGQAAVFAARLAADDGDLDSAVASLDGAARSLDGYWGEQAREVMASLPETRTEEWRRDREAAIAAVTGASLRRALGAWVALEPDAEVRLVLRARIATEVGLGSTSEPVIPPGLAQELWSLGLERDAVQWDPSGLPRGDVSAATWSATRFLEFGLPWNAVRLADGAWHLAGSEMPICAFPEELRRAYFPLLDPSQLAKVAAGEGLPWHLLAAVVREESRWNPHAVSVVGARGLVQLMPATAAAVAVNLGEEPPSPEELFDPDVSLRLGSAELSRLLEVFDGRWAPAVAAYNAGEAQAKLWLDQCGANCSDALYLGNISFKATRGYTADVLGAAKMYAELYSGEIVATAFSD